MEVKPCHISAFVLELPINLSILVRNSFFSVVYNKSLSSQGDLALFGCSEDSLILPTSKKNAFRWAWRQLESLLDMNGIHQFYPASETGCVNLLQMGEKM